ncbi:unnamed protein product [Brassica oleracea var. botrytis]
MEFSVSGPSLHHILFADDSIFICKATLDQCEELKKILSIYGGATGQLVNPLLWQTFGGTPHKIKERYIGLVGTECVYQNKRED